MANFISHQFSKQEKEVFRSEDGRVVVTEDDVHTTRYYKDGLLHRDGDKPAYVGIFHTIYFKHGQVHRDNGVAYKYLGFRNQEDRFYHGERISFVQAQKVKQGTKKGVKPIIPTSKRIVKKVREVNPTDNFNDVNRKLLNVVVENTYDIEKYLLKIEDALSHLNQLIEGEIDNLYQYTVEKDGKDLKITRELLENYGLIDFYQNNSQVIEAVDQEHTVEEAKRLLLEVQPYFQDFLKNILEYASYPLYAHVSSSPLDDLTLPEDFQDYKLETQFHAFGYKNDPDVYFGYNVDNQQLEISFIKQLENGKKVVDKQKSSFYAAFSELMDDQNLYSIIKSTEEHITNLNRCLSNLEELSTIVQSSIKDKIEFTLQQLSNLLNDKENEFEDMRDMTKQHIAKFL